MQKKSKRMIFWTLCSLFILYSFGVDTFGTSFDRGEAMLNDSARAGKLLFQKYNCTACHQLYGLGGYMGPDLTNVISAPGKGIAYANAFLTAGTARMPNFHLSETEKQQLLSYLVYVDRTGSSPVKDAVIRSNGSIILPGEK